MEIYILRHGIAEERAPGKADRTRALTEKGRQKLRRVLERAQAARVSPSLILTSPYLRTVQTAEMAAEVLQYRGSIVHCPALQPDSNVNSIWQAVRKHPDQSAILLSGHEPLLGEFLSFLLGSNLSLVDLKKGALARIDLKRISVEPRGLLCWLLTAKLA